VPDVAPHHVRSPLGKSLTLSLIAVLVACAALPTRAETSLTVPPGLARSETGELQATAAPLEATYYVAPDGDDRNDGRTVETPFATIAKAASVVRPGDVVMLRGGVYHEYNVRDSWVTSGEPGRPITFMSYPGERAVIDGSHVERDPRSQNPSAPQLIRVVGLDWYVFDGLVLRNGAGRGIALEGDHHVARNLVVHSNHGDGIFVRGNHNLIEDSITYDNYSRSTGGESADGVKIDSGEGNVIRRVVSYANSDDGIDLWATTGSLVEYCVSFRNGRGEFGDGMGFKMSRGGLDSGNVLRFNVAFDNRSHNFTDNGGGALTVYNNTSFGAGWAGFHVPGSSEVTPSTLTNNISFRDTEGVKVVPTSEGGPGPVSRNNSWDLGIDDPLFVSLDPDDPGFLRLRPDSPAVDAGADVGEAFAGTAPDLGAYELQSTAER